ncbi:hypothetical protein [Winogradskyella wichelsiae]|uniref:hypothetical protein n=1 Tax=Winogradskyella wichelsiae TaxID=2697007 RepID=UPI003EF8E32F
MKIKILVLIVSCYQLTAFSQTFKGSLPYKQDNLWGVIDTTQQIIIEPQYKRLRVLGDLDYVQFDGKQLFDINKGVKIDSEGIYANGITIEEHRYFLFNTDEKSTLIDLKRQDTINLSLKYDRMYNVSLLDPKTNKKRDYIAGALASRKMVLLKNNKDLPLAAQKKFDEFDFVYGEDYRSFHLFIGKVKNKSYVYNSELRLIRSVVNTDEYEVMSMDQLDVLAKTLKFDKLRLKCFSCAEVQSSFWSFSDDPILPEIFTVEYKNNRLFVTYKPTEGDKIEVSPELLYGNEFIGDVETLGFGKNEVIVDYRYVKTKMLMFPESELKQIKN